jgi:hypothetical protein
VATQNAFTLSASSGPQSPALDDGTLRCPINIARRKK